MCRETDIFCFLGHVRGTVDNVSKMRLKRLYGALKCVSGHVPSQRPPLRKKGRKNVSLRRYFFVFLFPEK